MAGLRAISFVSGAQVEPELYGMEPPLCAWPRDRRRPRVLGEDIMASTSKNGSSLTRHRDKERDEAWKAAPSRETTHDHPHGRDEATRRIRKPLENAPGLGKQTPRRK